MQKMKERKILEESVEAVEFDEESGPVAADQVGDVVGDDREEDESKSEGRVRVVHEKDFEVGIDDDASIDDHAKDEVVEHVDRRSWGQGGTW